MLFDINFIYSINLICFLLSNLIRVRINPIYINLISILSVYNPYLSIINSYYNLLPRPPYPCNQRRPCLMWSPNSSPLLPLLHLLYPLDLYHNYPIALITRSGPHHFNPGLICKYHILLILYSYYDRTVYIICTLIDLCECESSLPLPLPPPLVYHNHITWVHNNYAHRGQ